MEDSVLKCSICGQKITKKNFGSYNFVTGEDICIECVKKIAEAKNKYVKEE